jgi:hypothetical protein
MTDITDEDHLDNAINDQFENSSDEFFTNKNAEIINPNQVT